MQPSSELELTAVCRGQRALVKEPLGHPGELSSSLWLQESPRAAFSHCGNESPVVPWPPFCPLRGMWRATFCPQGSLDLTWLCLEC